jgi:cytochrome c-type biogenesis protein CcmH
MKSFIKIAMLMLVALNVQAGSVGEQELSFPNDANLQQRYDTLTQELRCPKCQNNNIADSDAPIARDFRKKTHQLLVQGKSNDEVVEYFVSRYGAFVNYKPKSLWIWLLPIVVLFAALIFAVVFMKTYTEKSNKQLSEAEQQRLKKLLAEHK